MKRYCGPTCNVIVEGHGAKCPEHQKSAFNRATSTRKSGRWLQRQRKELFDRNPLCVLCQAKGIVRVATIRDHIVNLQEGGQDIPSNTQGLCQECSDRKTEFEAKRGTRRWLERGNI